MTNNILTLRRADRPACTWISTGNPRTPLACIWRFTTASGTPTRASSSNDESGRMLLCA